MKKSLTIFLLLIVIITLSLTLVACGDKEHKHELVEFNAVSPTCTENGNIAYWHCTLCDKYFADAQATKVFSKDSWVIPATGHKYDHKWSFDKTYHWHSAICEHNDLTADKSEHTFVDGVCTVCQYIEDSDIPVEFSINFYANNILIHTTKSSGNEVISLPQAPTVDGYEFAGWYLDNNTWKIPFAGDEYIDTALTENISVYAKYEKTTVVPTKYNITFFANGQVVKVIQSSGNEVISLPQAPTVDGYEFAGWYLNNNTWKIPFVGNEYNNTALTENISVYAKYEKTTVVPTKYNITFFANGQVVKVIQSSGNEVISLPQAPTVVGYEFAGWYLDNNIWKVHFVGNEYNNTALTKNLSVYAKYDKVYVPPKKYDITFHADGQIVEVIQSSGNEVIKIPTAPHKDYHNFAGWYLDEGTWQQQINSNSFVNTAIDHAINVYAKYEPILHKVSFDTDGGTKLSTLNVYVIQSSPVTTKEGYDFVGWYTDKSFTQKVIFPYYPSTDITLYAKWESNELKPHCTINSNGIITSVENLVYENTSVVIPDMVNGTVVRGIGSNIFSGNANIVSVSMPDTVTTIQMGAFKNCPNLREVILSPNVTSIPEDMLLNCSSLTSINIPSTVKTIGRHAFMGTSITSIVIPSSVDLIAQYAFKDCTKLQSVIMYGVETIEQGVFENCTQLSKVVFSDKITDLSGSYIFKNCTSLATITLPEHSIKLNYTFLNDTLYYDTASNWDNGVLYVGNHLICVNTKFTATDYTVRASTVDIANYGLKPATMVGITLKSVTLPEGLKRIGDGAFEMNENLAKVNIPSTVEFVGSEIFYWTSIDDEYVDNWLVSYSNLSGEVLTIREGTVGIANGEIFGSNYIIKEVILPSSLRYIGENNFKNFSALTTINLPDGLVKIGDNAFNGCVNLVNISTQQCKELEYIGETAFSWCGKVTSFYIPKSVKFVGRSAFNQCKAVIDIEMQQNEISGWHEEWFGTYGPDLKINYGVSSAI